MLKNFTILILVLCLFQQNTFSQVGVAGSPFPEDDLNVGDDIFQDFNEDLEATQVMEDERFYRYARFYSIQMGLGFTTFTGNRGLAYEDNNPSFNFGLMYFLDFQNVFVMGIAYSKHTMFIDTYVNGSKTEIIGAVETNMLRPYFGFRYYMDTSDLGTAITYSSPYFVGRVEYWYQTNTFPENADLSDQEGGGLGAAAGFGLEFPIEIKKTYFNIEFLYHRVNFFDKFTQDFRQIPDEDVDQTACGGNPCESEFGFDDLRGDVITVMFNYTISY